MPAATRLCSGMQRYNLMHHNAARQPARYYELHLPPGFIACCGHGSQHLCNASCLPSEYVSILACCECGAARAQAAAQAEAARAEAAAHQTKEQELWASARAAGNKASHIASTKARAVRRGLPTVQAVA